MRLRRAALILPLLSTMLCAAPALAQREDCRKPTPAEAAATRKMVAAAEQVVEGPMASLGWKLEGRKSDGMPPSIGVDSNPPRPLGSCWPLYAATFTMTAAHSRYAALKAQADKGMEVMQTWMGACIKNGMKGCDQPPPEAKAGVRATAAFKMEIRVGENTPYMRSPRPVLVHKLDVPGTAVAYDAPDQDETLKVTTLCFGPWKPEVVFAADKSSVLFPFKHPRLTPFIENICVNIRATPEDAAELLRQADWKPLGAALTP